MRLTLAVVTIMAVLGCGIKIPPELLDCRTLGCPQDYRCVQKSPTEGYVCEQIEVPPPPVEPPPVEPPPVEPPPVEPPPVEPPPVLDCDVASIPISNVSVNAKEYSRRTKPNGEVIRTFDSTLKIRNAAWCAAHGMAEYGLECPLAPEGDACRNVRERYVLAPHVCPRFVFLSCTASCPGTFDALIGDKLHYINVHAGCPWPTNIEVVEAFWAQPEGQGIFAACLWTNGPDGKPLGCGRQFSVDQ